MIPLTKDLGALIRWLCKGCKTSLRDEVEGNLSPLILKSYDTENYIIGVVSAFVIISLIAWLMFGLK
jgi:transposase-like protein